MLGAVISYIMTPIAAHALGFDPSMTWQYVLAFGILPLFLAFPAVLHVAFLFQVLSGAFFYFEGYADLAEKLGLVAIISAISAATYWLIATYVKAPVTGMDMARLILASPFIAGIVACVIIAVGALSVGILEYFRSQKSA